VAFALLAISALSEAQRRGGQAERAVQVERAVQAERADQEASAVVVERQETKAPCLMDLTVR